MAGRKPKPTAVKKLEGNPGKSLPPEIRQEVKNMADSTEPTRLPVKIP